MPLWRGDFVSIKQLVEDFAKYMYLPRLSDPSVLLNAAREGVALLTWEQDSFAFADSYDETAKRYRGLRGGQRVDIINLDTAGLIVKSDVARGQLDQEVRPTRIEVKPEHPGLAIGAEVVFSAIGIDADGHSAPLSKVNWSATGGAITADGLFKAGDTEGECAIEVEFQGLFRDAAGPEVEDEGV